VVPSVVTVLEERIKEVTMIIIADDSVVVWEVEKGPYDVLFKCIFEKEMVIRKGGEQTVFVVF
jgi:hypothetical protein